MGLFQLFAVLITVAAVLSGLRGRSTGLPISILLVSVVMSLMLLAMPKVGAYSAAPAFDVGANGLLMRRLLGFLLFACAVRIDLTSVREHPRVVGVLAVSGVVTSVALVGPLIWAVAKLAGVPLPLVYALVLGAVLSPIDPIAVPAALAAARAPKRLAATIGAESLASAALGVVLFALVGEMTISHALTATHLAVLFAQETVGGSALGMLSGLLANVILRRTCVYAPALLVTLAVAAGLCAVAEALHLSGSVALVVAGAMMSGARLQRSTPGQIWEHVEAFWELVAALIGAFLILCLGLELLNRPPATPQVLTAAAAIPIMQMGRLAALELPIRLLRWQGDFDSPTVRIFTTAGLRGAVSVALALALPLGAERQTIVVGTAAVVLFSLVVQNPLLRWLVGQRRAVTPPELGESPTMGDLSGALEEESWTL